MVKLRKFYLSNLWLHSPLLNRFGINYSKETTAVTAAGKQDKQERAVPVDEIHKHQNQLTFRRREHYVGRKSWLAQNPTKSSTEKFFIVLDVAKEALSKQSRRVIDWIIEWEGCFAWVLNKYCWVSVMGKQHFQSTYQPWVDWIRLLWRNYVLSHSLIILFLLHWTESFSNNFAAFVEEQIYLPQSKFIGLVLHVVHISNTSATGRTWQFNSSSYAMQEFF